MSLFAVTRGQFSMIDAVLHTLDQVGRAKLSIWTWAIAEYEIETLERLMMDERLTEARLNGVAGGHRNKPDKCKPDKSKSDKKGKWK